MESLALTLSCLGIFLWSGFVEPRWIHINTHRIRVQKKLPRLLRILHLSDLHFESHDHGLFRFFSRLSQETFDLVLITGDIIDCNAGIKHCIRNLAQLHARYGIFAVLGNHDYYNYEAFDVMNGNLPFLNRFPKKLNDADALVRQLRELGVHVLLNAEETVVIDGCRVLIRGLDDPTTGRADFKMFDSKPSGELVQILLAHSIDVLGKIPSDQIDVCLSGHSHGGQIRIPGIGALITHTRFGRKYASGIHDYQGTVCVVSRGLHAGRAFRFRFFCPPEAVILEVEGETS